MRFHRGRNSRVLYLKPYHPGFCVGNGLVYRAFYPIEQLIADCVDLKGTS